MQVWDLIDRLSELPKNAEVYFAGQGDGGNSIQGVSLISKLGFGNHLQQFVEIKSYKGPDYTPNFKDDLIKEETGFSDRNELIKAYLELKETSAILFQDIDDGGPYNEPIFDFSIPEDIIVEIKGPIDGNIENKDWMNWTIENYSIIRDPDSVAGAASYQDNYDGLLYVIEEIITPTKSGVFIIEGVTAIWTSHDEGSNVDFNFTKWREATEEESELL